jgi:xanthine/CO dehydrogenase XdhC/CoxF family maturation factor
MQTRAAGWLLAESWPRDHIPGEGSEDMNTASALDTARDPLLIAQDWKSSGRDVVLATVVETWGSAPRPVGSHLVIDSEGNFHGSVSGGCVEGAVVAEAGDVIDTGRPRMLEFGVADETAWKVGLSCGGRIKVYVERLD